jgi:hypothetical protein
VLDEGVEQQVGMFSFDAAVLADRADNKAKRLFAIACG